MGSTSLFLQRVAKISLDDIDLLRLAPNWQDRVDASPVVYRGLRGARGYRFDAMRFADMTIPTLLLSGSESPLYLRAATKAVDEALPNSRIVVFDGHGHMAMLTATDRFIDEMLAFAHEAD